MEINAIKLDGIQAVLFDLDGTLVDTAPDLGYALNLQRARHGLPPLADDVIRPQASHGARGLLGVGFDLHPDNAKFASMREEFLQLYADNICRHSRPFDGILDLLAALDARQLKWGVVTNKPARFTEPLMSILDLAERAACIVSGDTCPQPKPHPAPMLAAAELCGVDARAMPVSGRCRTRHPGRQRRRHARTGRRLGLPRRRRPATHLGRARANPPPARNA